MKYRIHKILLVCCSYDGYILEEDGHIESRIKEEYLDLNRKAILLKRLKSSRSYDIVYPRSYPCWAVS